MEAILLLFLRALVPLGLLGGAVYLAFGPGRKWLERILAPVPPYLREARAIAMRIGVNLASASPEVSRKCMADIESLVEHRLPRILEQYERLTRHLSEASKSHLADEVTALTGKLARTKDEGLRSILEENLTLARERLMARERMELLTERTEAQLKQVLLYLEAVESKSVSLGVSEPGEDVPAEMERMLEEISTIEAMYRDLDGARAGDESVPPERDRGRGGRKRQSTEE
ncbi:MAG: hypothetical protein HY303_16130 [Candidatus Wallbacteria bacterium]|nr:hypothetical protein [Candidatus Wallbacteria bacterium]